MMGVICVSNYVFILADRNLANTDEKRLSRRLYKEGGKWETVVRLYLVLMKIM
jgi:hypothetical protein